VPLNNDIDSIFDEVLTDDRPKEELSESDIDSVFSAVQSASELPGSQPALAPQVGQMELGEPGAPISARLAAGAGDTPAEKLQAIRKLFPKAELQEVVAQKGTRGTAVARRLQTRRGFETFGSPSGRELASETDDETVLLFRPDPSQPWVKFDPGVFEKFTPGEIAADLGEMITGDVGQIAGEIAALTPQGRAAGLAGQITRIGAGSFAGEMAQEGAEQAVGIGDESLGESTGRAAGESLFSAIGAALTAPFSMTWDVVTGKGMLAKTEAGKEAVAAAERLGLEHGPMVHQVARWPLIQKMGRMAEQTSDRVAAYKEAQRQEIAGIIRDMKKKPADVGKLREQLSALHNTEIKDLLGELRKTDVSVTLSEGGEAIKAGLDIYRRKSQERLSQLYQVAEEIEAPVFDASSLVAKAKELNTSTPVKLASGDVVNIANVSGELRNIVNLVSQMDPNVATLATETGEVAAHQQLRAIRQQLFDLKQPGPDGTFRNEQRLASELYREVNRVLRNPTNENKAFVDAWKFADQEAAKRFEFLESAAAISIAKNESPGFLAKQFAQPLMAPQLREIRARIPNEKFRELQLSFHNDLIDKMARQQADVNQIFSQFDEPTLDILMSPAERTQMVRINDELIRRRRPNYQAALEKQSKDARVLDELIRTDSTAAIDEFRKLVERNGGKESPFGVSVSTGLRNMIAERVLKKADGSEKVAADLLEQELKALNKSGAIRMMRREDLNRLRLVSDLAPILKMRSDVGAGISGTEQARAAISLGQQGHGTGLLNLVENYGIAFLSTNRLARNILLGRSSVTKPDADYRSLRLMGAILADMNNEIEMMIPEEEGVIE
jgi:hypothetical protein